MERPRHDWLLAVFALALAGCKGKASEGTSVDAGATAASATASASAAPLPSASSAPTLATLMGFEGEVDMIARSADPTKPVEPVTMLVKADKIRLDAIPGTDTANTLGGKAFMLVRAADKKADVVSDARRVVIELDLANPDNLKNLAKASAAPGQKTKPEPPPKVSKTGTRETVAGYPCEDWEVTETKDNRKKASLCVADLPSSFFHIPLTGVPAEYAYTMDLVDGQHFPLRIVAYDDHTGAESGRLEVTKLDPHSVDAAKFQIPAGYQTMDMLQMVQALSGHGGGSIPGMPSNLPNMPQHPHHPHH